MTSRTWLCTLVYGTVIHTSKVLTDMPAGHLHLLRAVDVGEQSQTEPVTARWIGEAVDGQWRQRRMKRLANTTVQFVVRNTAPVRRLHVHHWLHWRWNWRRRHCHYHKTSPVELLTISSNLKSSAVITFSTMLQSRCWCHVGTCEASIRIRIGRFPFHSKVTGWFEIFESAATAVVPQTTLTAQQKTSTVAPL